MLPLTLTIPPRGGVQTVTTTQTEQKFHRPFEVASRVDAASHRNKITKPSHSNSTPDRPPPPLVHRNASERNGTALEVQRRQQAAARLDVKFGALSAAGTADDTPLNLVIGRHGSSQHSSPSVNCSNTSDLSTPVLQPNVVSDSCHRQRNKSDTSSSSHPLVSLLDRKSAMKAARQKWSDGNSSEEEDSHGECDVAEAKRRARLLLITSGPPLKPDNSPSKMKFLQQFGLVTSSVRAGEGNVLEIHNYSTFSVVSI